MQICMNIIKKEAEWIICNLRLLQPDSIAKNVGSDLCVFLKRENLTRGRASELTVNLTEIFIT